MGESGRIWLGPSKLGGGDKENNAKSMPRHRKKPLREKCAGVFCHSENKVCEKLYKLSVFLNDKKYTRVHIDQAQWASKNSEA